MRILLTADWHINDYKNFNPSVKFRLHQFIKLAYHTVEIGKEQNCRTLVIAGDLIDIPVLRPGIQHVVKKVIDILKGGFDTIYYILGQHDLDTKGDITSEDTILSLYDDNKFLYANHKILEIDGLRIGFQNWSAYQDTSWIEEPLDILIGHYTKSNLFGQEIDDSKFDLMIHGDIHNSQVIGKFVSICNPIQKDMSSEASGSMIVYDTEKKDWERIKIDEPHTRYLRIEYTRNPEEEGFHSSILYKIFKPIDVNASGEQYEVPIPEWNEINELIDGCVDRAQLRDIHNEVLAKCQSYQEVDFNFQLKYIDIKGFRSIDNMRLDFTGNDIILLLGENGSGKSSILTALHHLFYYDTHLQDEKSDFDDEEETHLQLEYGLYYQNKFYVIRKGETWGLEIDGVEQGFPSKPQFEQRLPEYLPFLNYSDVYFISSTISNLSGCYSPERRSELLSKFFKFDKVLAYSQTALDLRNQTSIEYGEIERQKNEILSVIKYLEEQLQKSQEYEEDDEFNTNFEIERLEELKKKFSLYEKWDRNHNVLLTRLQVQKDNYKQNIEFNSAGLDNPEEVIKELETRVSNKKEKLEKLKADYKEFVELKKQLLSSVEEKDKLSEELLALEGCTCPTCGGPLISDKQKELMEKYKSRQEVVLANYLSLKKRYETLTPRKEDKSEDKMYYQYNIDLLSREIKTLTIELEDVKKSLYKQQENLRQRELIQKNIKDLEEKVAESISVMPEKVSYDSSNDIRLRELSGILEKIKSYKEKKSSLEQKKTELSTVEGKLLPLEERITRLYNYSAMTSTVGDVYTEVLARMAKSFSSERIRWYVETGTYRRKDYLIFQAQLRVKKKWRDYDSLSSGQKNLVDLDFISKMLATRSGLLALDEILKHLDENNSVEAAELLSRLNTNTLLVATHSVSFPTYTQKLRLELDESGRTRVSQD